MKSNIEAIYEDFEANYEKAPEYVIDFFSRNHLLLNNIKNFNDKEDLRLFIDLSTLYLFALYEKDRYNDTIDFADKILEPIDNELIRLNAEGLKDDKYNSILHFKGIAAYRLRDYQTSTETFKYLARSDPKNENYKDWLNNSKYRQRLWLVNTVNIVCGLLLLISLFFVRDIEIFGIKVPISGIAVLGIVANWGYEAYVKRSFRKAKKAS